MSGDYYENIGKLLNASFANDIDPFELANKKKTNRRGYRYFQEEKKEMNFNDKSNYTQSQEHKNFASNFEKKENVFNKRYSSQRVPQRLLKDFATLRVLPSSSLQECKHAWKTLLKKYHPDSSADNSSQDIVIRLNSSYRRIEQWFKSEKI